MVAISADIRGSAMPDQSAQGFCALCDAGLGGSGLGVLLCIIQPDTCTACADNACNTTVVQLPVQAYPRMLCGAAGNAYTSMHAGCCPVASACC